MFSVSVKDKEMEDLIVRMARASNDMKPLMTTFYGKIHFEVMKNFRTQSAPPDIFTEEPGNQRKSWKPISSYTAAYRLGSRPSTSRVGAILQETGTLMGSMGKVRIITKTGMTYGTNSAISHVHHFGAKIKPKGHPYLALPYPGIKGRPRQYKDAFFIGKTLYRNIKSQRSGGSTLEPLFFLKKSVTIAARPHLTIPSSTIDNMRILTWDYYVKRVQ